MNAHALAALTTRQPDHYPSTEEWIEHCAAIQYAWDALDEAVRPEIQQ